MTSPIPADELPTHPDVEIKHAEIGFARFLRHDVVHFRQRLYSGEWSPVHVYDVSRRGPAVAILLYDPDRDAVVMVEQFRLAPIYADMPPWLIEPVAGLIEPGESYEDVARRECREEAGLDPIGELIPIQRYLPSPGASDETVMLFCGRVDSRNAGGVHGLADEHEDIRVVVKSFAEIEAMVDTGQVETGHTLICLYWLLRHRERIRRMWLGA
jgi:ADP-ribose pyrophosphatase